jgi:hypothetical protein
LTVNGTTALNRTLKFTGTPDDSSGPNIYLIPDDVEIRTANNRLNIYTGGQIHQVMNNDGTTFRKNLTVDGDLSVKGTNILAKITEMENILKNHYNALLMLCEKHGMIDGDGDGASNISPK